MSDIKQVTPEDITELRALLEKAKLQLMCIPKSIFTTTVITSLVHKLTYEIPTLAVDGVYLYINPDFFRSLSAPVRVFALAHEAWHVVYEHVLRAMDIPEVNHDIYNQAADHVINLMLKEKGYTIWDRALADPKFSNMCTEQVYAQLLKNPPKDKNPMPDVMPASTGSSPIKDPQTGDTMSEDDIKTRINDTVIKAHIANAMQDKDASEALGAELLARINELVNPTVPWNIVFQNLLVDKLKNDYSFKKPNRRFSGSDIIMPALYSEGIKDYVIATDVSYSITPDEFKAFLSEAEASRELLKPEFTTVIQWHTAIAKLDKVPIQDSIVDIEFKETGGTNIYPLFKYLIKHPPKVAVIFTDGEFSMWDKPEEITFPVIWVIYNQHRKDDWFKPLFGEVVYYDPAVGV